MYFRYSAGLFTTAKESEAQYFSKAVRCAAAGAQIRSPGAIRVKYFFCVNGALSADVVFRPAMRAQLQWIMKLSALKEQNAAAVARAASHAPQEPEKRLALP
jgi:hypothetical protein